jgi:hypothetical protein
VVLVVVGVTELVVVDFLFDFFFDVVVVDDLSVVVVVGLTVALTDRSVPVSTVTDTPLVTIAGS